MYKQHKFQSQRKLLLVLGFSFVAAIFNGSLACVAYQTHFQVQVVVDYEARGPLPHWAQAFGWCQLLGALAALLRLRVGGAPLQGGGSLLSLF